MFLPSGGAFRRKDFDSEFVKLTQITSESRFNIALFALAQVTKIGRANALNLSEILIFDLFENDSQRF